MNSLYLVGFLIMFTPFVLGGWSLFTGLTSPYHMDGLWLVFIGFLVVLFEAIYQAFVMGHYLGLIVVVLLILIGWFFSKNFVVG